MYYVYVIYSDRFDQIYIGFTTNVPGRIDAHNHNRNKGWTKKFQPWRLLYEEAFTEKSEALRREMELKSHQGRVFIRNFLLSHKK